MVRLVLALALFLPSLARAQTLIYNSTSSPLQETLEDLANQIQQNKAAVNNILLSTSGAAGLSSNNFFTGTNTFTVPTVPIFISSQDVVSVATVTFSIPSSSTSYRFDFIMSSTSAWTPRMIFGGDTTTNYTTTGVGVSVSQIVGADYTSARACDVGDTTSGTNSLSANATDRGSFTIEHPRYSGGPKTANALGLIYASASPDGNAIIENHGCSYDGSGTPSTISVIYSQAIPLTTAAGNNNMVTGHFELWQIGSTHP